MDVILYLLKYGFVFIAGGSILVIIATIAKLARDKARATAQPVVVVEE